MSKSIIHYIGATIILIVLSGAVLAALGKTPPEYSADVLKIGLSGLCGAVVGGSATYAAMKPRDPHDPTPRDIDEEEGQ